MDNYEEDKPRIEHGRQFLKSNWELVGHTQSDQSKGIPAPVQQKPCPEDSNLIHLPAPEGLTIGRMEWRYSVVSHKIIAIDAGHVCQNLYLACGSIGCGTCAIGAYDQEKMDRLLGIDGQEEFTIYAAPVGRVLPGSPMVE